LKKCTYFPAFATKTVRTHCMYTLYKRSKNSLTRCLTFGIL
jgi:hypothetical protein